MFLISIYLEEYKKVELSALQCLSVSLFRNSNGQGMKSKFLVKVQSYLPFVCSFLGNFTSGFLVPVTLCSGSKPSVLILPQPKYSSLRRNLFWIKPQLTGQDLHHQASEPCLPSANYSTESSPEHSPPPWTNSPVPQQHQVNHPRLHIILPTTSSSNSKQEILIQFIVDF
ncbi:hypothetical protein XENOCAPTIV_024730 [Xenoophorus captivus]|uniref:Uncharacterized protein n=1 Tax=Xenoophorus captivus TaxID=1517983 RepID=A0ABV0RS13_9TELE